MSEQIQVGNWVDDNGDAHIEWMDTETEETREEIIEGFMWPLHSPPAAMPLPEPPEPFQDDVIPF